MTRKMMMWALTAMMVVCAGQVYGAWSTVATADTLVCDASATNTRGHYILHDGKGGYFVVWHDNRNIATTGDDIFAQYFDKAGDAQWTANGVTVCNATNAQDSPKVILDGAGGIIMTWNDNRDGATWDMFAQRLDQDGTALWAANGVQVFDETLNNWPCAWSVADGVGGAIVFDRYGSMNRIDKDGTLLWGAADACLVYDATAAGGYLKAVPDGAAGAYFIYEPASDDVAVQRVDGDGNLLWNSGAPVELTDTASAYCYRMLRNGTAGVFVIWQDSGDVRIQKVNAAGVPQWTDPNGVLVTTDSTDAYEICLALDGAGGVYVTWGSSADGGVYAQRLGPDGTELWTAGGLKVADPGEWAEAGDPPRKTVEDGAGGFITAWVATTDLAVRAQRVNRDGTPLWGANGVALATKTASTRTDLRLEGNGQGGAVALFTDNSSTDTQNYIQAVTKDGVPGTPAFTPKKKSSSDSKCGVGGGLLLALAALGLALRRKHA